MEYDEFVYNKENGQVEIYLDGILRETTTIGGLIQRSGYKFVGSV